MIPENGLPICSKAKGLGQTSYWLWYTSNISLTSSSASGLADTTFSRPKLDCLNLCIFNNFSSNMAFCSVSHSTLTLSFVRLGEQLLAGSVLFFISSQQFGVGGIRRMQTWLFPSVITLHSALGAFMCSSASHYSSDGPQSVRLSVQLLIWGWLVGLVTTFNTCTLNFSWGDFYFFQVFEFTMTRQSPDRCCCTADNPDQDQSTAKRNLNLGLNQNLN